MFHNREATLPPAARLFPHRSVVEDWRLDERRRDERQREEEIGALEKTIEALQETIRSSTGKAVDLQRSLLAKERRICELEATVSLLEEQVVALRRALRGCS